MDMRPLVLLALLFALWGCQEKPPTADEFRILAAKGLTDSVRRASMLGVKLDSTDENGFSALSVAAYNGCRETVEELLKLGANPDAGPSPSRALVLASTQGHVQIVEMLLKHGAQIEYGPQDEQPLAVATDRRIIDVLLRAGADINKPSGSVGNTPLYRCASKADVEAMRYLIAKGAKVNTANSFGATPLHAACRTLSLLLQEDGVERAKETIRVLIEAGADVKIADMRSNTPLHLAARNAFLDSDDLRLLILRGASLEARDMMGRTPLAVAQVFQTDRLPGRLAALSSKGPNQPK
jgi:ankyrin repeat protein